MKNAAQTASRDFRNVHRLAPRLYDPGAWTDPDSAAVAAHLKYLTGTADSGRGGAAAGPTWLAMR